MIITELYNTKITCSTYDTMLNTNGITITVKLEDFNKQAITGKPVTLTCSKGYFTSVTHNGGTTSLNKTKTTNSYNTNSNGEITAIWTASEEGLCTFSANNTKIQINVNTPIVTKGFSGTSSGINYFNKEHSFVKFVKYGKLVICSFILVGLTTTTTGNKNVLEIPSSFYPSSDNQFISDGTELNANYHDNDVRVFIVLRNGKWYLYISLDDTSPTKNIRGQLVYMAN